MVGLVINARSLDRQVTGVETYAREMASILARKARAVAPRRRLPGWVGHAWEQLALPGFIQRGEVLWSPANTGPLRVENQVLSLHDIFALEHPEWYRETFTAWYRWLLPRLVRKVCWVITPSEWSRKQILNRFPFLIDKLYVVRAGINRARFRPRPEGEVSAVRLRYRLPEDYLLFVGTIEPRKNIPRLLEAWESMRGEFPGRVLAVAGGKSPVFREVNLEKLALQAHKAVAFLGYVPDEDLPALYSGAQGVVIPSLVEGFGLPALEGMACGAPVICSATGALPEIVGRVGLLVNPVDVQALAGAMRQLLADKALRVELCARGLARAREFSWENAVDQLLKILGGCCQSDAI
jgi:glycosyltransferase involved in cell wall biosynthesis